jgi:hypothetical protein
VPLEWFGILQDQVEFMRITALTILFTSLTPTIHAMAFSMTVLLAHLLTSSILAVPMPVKHLTG